MKSISPWFETARLLLGIRKTYSEIEAHRSVSSRKDRKSGTSIRQLQESSKAPSKDAEAS